MTNVIQSVLDDHSQLTSALSGEENLSLRLAVDRHFQRLLVVAIASYCEDQVKDIILEFVAMSSSNCEEIVNLIKNKALERQYHTLFDWKTDAAKGVNTFWSLLGESRRRESAEILRRDPSVAEKANAFIQIGQLRNRLVHGNFASMSIDLTISEITSKSELALGYVEFIRSQLMPRRPG